MNNWALSLEEYEITFEYIKGIKNTLGDAMSRLVHIDPTSQLEPEPEGSEFGELKVDEEELDKVEVQSERSQNTVLLASTQAVYKDRTVQCKSIISLDETTKETVEKQKFRPNTYMMENNILK